jgi:hypothetical protein
MFKKCKSIIVTTISFKKFKLHKSQNSAPPFRLIIVIENSLGVHEFDFFPEPLQVFFYTYTYFELVAEPIHTICSMKLLFNSFSLLELFVAYYFFITKPLSSTSSIKLFPRWDCSSAGKNRAPANYMIAFHPLFNYACMLHVLSLLYIYSIKYNNIFFRDYNHSHSFSTLSIIHLCKGKENEFFTANCKNLIFH